MALEWKGDSKFEELGSLNDFLREYGKCKITISDINEINICLVIKSEQQFEFKIYCSKALSEIVRENKAFPKDFGLYSLFRITGDNGEKYIRLTQAINIKIDPNKHPLDYFDGTKDMKGSIRYTFNIDEIDVEPYESSDPDLNNLIVF